MIGFLDRVSKALLVEYLFCFSAADLHHSLVCSRIHTYTFQVNGLVCHSLWMRWRLSLPNWILGLLLCFASVACSEKLTIVLQEISLSSSGDTRESNPLTNYVSDCVTDCHYNSKHQARQPLSVKAAVNPARVLSDSHCIVLKCTILYWICVNL